MISPHFGDHKSFLTSNCQWAACRSCFAWSAVHPAVRTNWFIITWFFRSSMFAETQYWKCNTESFPLLGVQTLMLFSLTLAFPPIDHADTRQHTQRKSKYLLYELKCPDWAPLDWQPTVANRRDEMRERSDTQVNYKSHVSCHWERVFSQS